MIDDQCGLSEHCCDNILSFLHFRLTPPPPSPRAMDEERSALAVSPEPPDDGDPAPAAPPPSDPNATSTTETANTCPSQKPRPSPGKEGVAVAKQDRHTQTCSVMSLSLPSIGSVQPSPIVQVQQVLVRYVPAPHLEWRSLVAHWVLRRIE